MPPNNLFKALGLAEPSKGQAFIICVCTCVRTRSFLDGFQWRVHTEHYEGIPTYLS